MKVSYSKIRTWRRCRQAYHYKYVEKIVKKIKAQPLVRGSIIHDMLELHIAGKDPWPVLKTAEQSFSKMFAEERAMYGETLNDIKKLMAGYFDFYEKDPIKYFKLNGQYTEHYFEVPLTPSITLIGYLDSFGTTRDGLQWLVEHKSHKQIPEGDFKFSDIQSALYTWVAPQIGLPEPDGVAWNYIKAVSLTEPEVLKSGELSKKASIATTWAVYREAIRKHKLDVNDYLDMKKILIPKENNFYVRKYLPVNKNIVSHLIEDAVKTAMEIKRKAGRDKTRNIDKHCEWCDYYPICQAELRGLDADFIRNTNYKVSDGKDRQKKKTA